MNLYIWRHNKTYHSHSMIGVVFTQVRGAIDHL